MTQKLVQVPPDDARGVPLERLGVRARREGGRERVERFRFRHALEPRGGEAQRPERVREAAQRVPRRRRRLLLRLPRLEERPRHPLRVELRVTRGLVVHHVAEQVRGEREHPRAEQARVFENQVERRAQRPVLQPRHLDVVGARGEVRQRQRAHQRLDQHAARGRDEVLRRRLVRLARRTRALLLLGRSVSSAASKRSVFRERVLRLRLEPLDENLHPAELAKRRRRRARVIHEYLQHVHRVAHDVHVARVPVLQQG